MSMAPDSGSCAQCLRELGRMTDLKDILPVQSAFEEAVTFTFTIIRVARFPAYLLGNDPIVWFWGAK